MPRPRLPMRKIRDVLRLSAAGMSKRKVAASLGVSATAAGECIRRARRAGLIWPLPDGLSDEALERQLFPSPAVAAKDRRPQPDWAAIHSERIAQHTTDADLADRRQCILPVVSRGHFHSERRFHRREERISSGRHRRGAQSTATGRVFRADR
jgi:hypothetical protein